MHADCVSTSRDNLDSYLQQFSVRANSKGQLVIDATVFLLRSPNDWSEAETISSAEVELVW